MKFRAYHVYFIALLISGLIGAYLDLNYSYQSTEFPELNGTLGFAYGVGLLFPYATILLISYYAIIYFYKRSKKSLISK